MRGVGWGARGSWREGGGAGETDGPRRQRQQVRAGPAADSPLCPRLLARRPCPLAQQYIGVTIKKPLQRFQLMNEICYAKVWAGFVAGVGRERLRRRVCGSGEAGVPRPVLRVTCSPPHRTRTHTGDGGGRQAPGSHLCALPQGDGQDWTLPQGAPGAVLRVVALRVAGGSGAAGSAARHVRHMARGCAKPLHNRPSVPHLIPHSPTPGAGGVHPAGQPGQGAAGRQRVTRDPAGR